MRIFFCSCILLAVGTSLAGGQNAPVVEARAIIATDATHANSTLKVAVLANVAPGFHINDHKPTLDYLIPTELKFDASNQFAVKNVFYPKGTVVKFPFSDTPLSVYQNDVTVGVLLEIGKSVPPGGYTLKGKFAYQACNDHACLPPASVPFNVALKVVPPDVPLKPQERNVFQRLKFE